MKRRPKSTEGTYSITSRDVSTSSASLGAAISKAITIGSRVQRAGLDDGEECRSIYIRRLGADVVARVDVRREIIHTFAYGGVR